ncbi:hypothetical protein RJT34_31660 [Clitoria ternatea]|uniref:Uncharacterized protein n=1 Tax=Clitoria ternatea TaxID=43366 RepID=A0AAN9EV21_CLITE
MDGEVWWRLLRNQRTKVWWSAAALDMRNQDSDVRSARIVSDLSFVSRSEFENIWQSSWQLKVDSDFFGGIEEEETVGVADGDGAVQIEDGSGEEVLDKVKK